MSWATVAKRTDCYQIVAGDEANPSTTYVPGEFLNINIRVTCIDKQYRGILIYAVDANNNRVGNWTLPKQDPPYFKQPWTDNTHPCFGSVMHATAEWKPYHSILYWKAPPTGTGAITFRCLIKYGNANTGDFYWPMTAGDLSLTEGPARPNPSVAWTRSSVGASCTDTCSAISKMCSETSLATLTKSALRSQIATILPCEVPDVSGCGMYPSVYDPAMGVCYYSEGNCTGRPARAVNCDTVVPSMARNCPCIAGQSSGTNTGTNSGTNSGTNTDSGTTIFESPANTRSPGLLAILLIFPFLFSANPRLAFALFLIFSVASAHNWINSLSRSPGASTYRPCKPPLTDMPHAQVGPGQSFEIEWMNGHGGDTYFVIIHRDNVDKLKLHTTTMLDDYINKAPNGSNRAMDPLRQKFHRKDSAGLNNTYTDANGVVVHQPGFYAGIIPYGDARFIYRPPVFGGRIGGITNPSNNSVHYQMLYNTTHLSTDRIVSYNSTIYPWIEAVYRFSMVTMQAGQPDVARFYIPGFGGLGRYIVQYLWRGYYDCVDVDLKPNPVPNVYGIAANATVWNRIDHCLFDGVRMVFRNAEIVTDASYCLAGCSTGDCYGVNIVPLKAPSSAYQGFTAPVNVTWKYPNVYGSDIYVPWDWGNFNSTRDQLVGISDEDRYICYAVQPKQFTDTEDEYKVASDPDDPIFYSTCYYRFSGNLFPEYLVNHTDPFGNLPWRYNSKCIDCESKARNSDPTNLFPKWKVTDTCVNCNAEPAVLAPAPVAILVENGTRCDGYTSWRNATTHQTCQVNTTVNYCVKQLYPIGRGSNAHITMDECRIMAENEPDCSKHYFRRNITNSYRCFCYRAESCCLTCSRVADPAYMLYESKTTPDPTCANGTLSADGLSCCSASCGAGQCIANAGNNRPQVGQCCSSCIPAARTCSQYSAPCKM